MEQAHHSTYNATAAWYLEGLRVQSRGLHLGSSSAFITYQLGLQGGSRHPAFLSLPSARSFLPGVAGARASIQASNCSRVGERPQGPSRHVPQGDQEGPGGLDPVSAPDCPESTPSMVYF